MPSKYQTRAKVLDAVVDAYLTTAGPSPTSDIAMRTGLTPQGVKNHLDELKKSDRVSRLRAPYNNYMTRKVQYRDGWMPTIIALRDKIITLQNHLSPKV